MEELIYKYAKKNSLIYGICDANRLELSYDLEKIDIPFTEKSIEKRINPNETFLDPKSIIIIGKSYLKKDTFEMDEKIRGVISLGAVGEDYHKELNRHLKEIGNILFEKQGKTFKYKYFTDTGPLIERELALKAGLGFRGKNQLIINKDLGSFFYIGHMITNIEIKKSLTKRVESLCGSCNKCILACPGNALEGGFNYKKCVSYLTQNKERLLNEEMEIMNKSIYGCDICQKVCPYNKDKYNGNISNIEERFPEIERFVGLNNTDFKEKYGNTSAFWRGKNILIRNALITLGNIGDKRNVGFLQRYLNSPSEIVREGAIYSISRL